MKTIPEKQSGNLLGDLNTYVKNPLEFLQTNSAKYGDIFKFRVAHRKLIFANSPDFIERVLQSNHRNYRKSLAYRKLELLLGNGLFNSDGEFWMKQRRLAQPSFHKERIKSYSEIIVKHTDQLVEKVSGNGELKLANEFTHLTLDIISETLLGLNLKNQGGVIEQHLPSSLKFMIKRITSALNSPLWIPTASNRSFKRSMNKIDSLIMDLIQEKRLSTESNNDLLSSLMNATDTDTGETMSDKQLRDEILTFFLAGHETTAITLFWSFCLILTNADIEKRLTREVQNLPDELDFESLKEANYLDAVIHESMRYISPIWVISREAIGDDELRGYQIEKGDSIVFSPYLIHRHPEYWENPKLFIPERFLDNTLNHKFSFFPFGGGPRLCIGNNFALLELKIILVKFFRSFKMSLVEKTIPDYDCSLTLRPANERTVKLQRIGL